MKTYADKKQDNTSKLVATASRKQSGGEITSQFVDNRPEAIAQRKLQEMVNNSISRQQNAIQMMAKETEGSDEYNSLKDQKDHIDGQMVSKTGEEIKAEALQELVDLKDSQLRKFGVAESYTPYYKDESKSQELRTAWRMCEDERMGGDPMHNHQTKQEIDVYVTKREARIREKYGRDNYELKQKSDEIAQLKK